MGEQYLSRLPLIVGIVGHRDLRDEDAESIQREIASILAKLTMDYLGGERQPPDEATPILLLSGLAGTAHAATLRAATAANARLLSVADFIGPGEPAAAGAQDEHARDHAAGLFLARYCHVVIAVWDENRGDETTGSIAQIVRFRAEGVPLADAQSARAFLDASQIGPVISVAAPRLSSPDRPPAVSTRAWGEDLVAPHREGYWCRLLRQTKRAYCHLVGRHAAPERVSEPAVESWERFAALIDLTVQFNAEAGRLSRGANAPAPAAKSLDELFWDAAAKKFATDAREHAQAAMPRWSNIYAFADTLAQRWQMRFKRDWRHLFALAFAAIAFFELFAHLAYLVPPMHELNVADVTLLFLYICAFAGVFYYYFAAHLGQHQERFLDYRALAEALRVGIFWKLAGVDHGGGANAPSVSVADDYPIKQPSELAWVKTCLRSLELLDIVEGAEVHRPAAAWSWVRDLWVGGQLAYFKKKARDYDTLADIHEAGSLILLGLSLVIALVLIPFICGIWADAKHFGHEAWRRDVLIFTIGVLPGLAAAFIGYSEKLAYKAQSRQYDRMQGVFSQALPQLSAMPPAGGPNAAGGGGLPRQLLRELGIEAMSEHAEWVAIYRQRPIHPL
jgi:hypothetical protein